METMNCLCYMTSLSTDICMTVTRLTFGIFSLKEAVESFYKYIWVLANHKANPLIVPPLELQHILLVIRQNIHLHPHLALTDNPNDISSRHDFFVGFNVIYQNIMCYGIWNELKLETLTPEQKDFLGVKLSEFPPMTLNHLNLNFINFI